MTLQLYWFLPSHGDGRDIAKTRVNADGALVPGRRRDVDLNYLAQVARATDGLGFTGALVPFGLFCEDPWVIAAALSCQTERLRFMLALRPGLITPMLLAQMSATFQRISGGRLLLNIVAGGDPQEQHRYGDWLDHDQRYARTDEFLTVLREAWSGHSDFVGEYYRVAGATVTRPSDALPGVFLGGSSSAATEVAARHADVYLCWGEPPPQMADQLDRVRETLARESDRRALSFGTRFHVISRDTSREAWQIAESVLAGVDPAMVEKSQQRFRASDSEGQRRMAALHDGRLDRLEVYPNVWTGYGLVRQGPSVTLVGSHEEVAERIAELHDLGIEHLILSGQPHLEEAYWVGEGVLPLLRAKGILDAESYSDASLAVRSAG